MRWLTLLLVGCLVLSAAGTTWSAMIFRQPYNGPVTLKFTSWDMGVVYARPTGLIDGIGAVNTYEASNGGVYAAAAGGAYYSTSGSVVPVNDANREDGWGILTVTQIYKTGGNPNSNPSDILWMPNDGGKEMGMLFYGLIDNAVARGGRVGEELIQSQNVRFDLYENSFGTFAAAGGPGQGSTGRTGFKAYNGITGGVLCISGYTIPGIGLIDNSTGPDEFSVSFTPFTGLQTGKGTFGGLLELDANTALLQRDYDQFNTDTMSLGADLTADGTTKPNDGSVGPVTGNWTVLNEDPFRGATPEPATLALLGVGGLAMFLRRRSRR
jgi:hypothetical protein